MVTIEEQGFTRMLRLRGRNCKLLSGPDSGKTFLATINRIGAFELVTELGADPRSKRIVEMAAAGTPKIISQSLFMDQDTKERFQMTDIALDSPVYSKKFVAKQVTL